MRLGEMGDLRPAAQDVSGSGRDALVASGATVVAVVRARAPRGPGSAGVSGAARAVGAELHQVTAEG